MPPGTVELALFTRLAIARMEVERLHYAESQPGKLDKVEGFNCAVDIFRSTLQAIIHEIGC